METTVDINDVAELFKVLGDHSRLSMVAMMYKKECCVCDFTECFNMSQPAVSQHLKRLRTLGLITERKDGYWTHLSLNTDSPFMEILSKLLATTPVLDAHADRLLASCTREACC